MEDNKPEKKVFKNVGVDYHTDGKIVLPEGMDLKTAQEWLATIEQEDNEWTAFSEETGAFLLDGARALAVAINRHAGHLRTVPTQSFFGQTPPMMVTLEIDHLGNTVSIPWGKIEVPGITGYFNTSFSVSNGRVHFRVIGKCMKRDLKKVQRIFELMREEIKANSIYRGKAFSINLEFDPRNPAENPPKFINHTKRKKSDLIFDRLTTERLQTSLFGPIEQTQNCRSVGIPLKRGILLHGSYGVGKSELATVMANVACANGWTYIYLTDASNLVNAYAVARFYSPAVIFCEDVDKVTSGDRNSEMDSLLNCMDGIESKSEEIVTVFTTNSVSSMHPAFMRPGRLDDVIEIKAPDKDTAIRLVKLFAGETLDQNSDLDKIGNVLAGQVPALIREVVERTRLAAMVRTGSTSFRINHNDIEVASDAMETHRRFINGQQKSLPPQLIERIGRGALGALLRQSDTIQVDGKLYSLKEAIDSGLVADPNKD